MSTRCYLYACDADPSLYELAPRGVCEHVGSVALLQRIMVARGARAIDSRLFGRGLAVLADASGAVDRALSFVDRLAESDIAEADDFVAASAQMQGVLATMRARYLLLEPGEVLASEAAVHGLIASLAELDVRVERALRGFEEPWLETLRASWQDSVMPWWSTMLYDGFEVPSSPWSRGDVEAMLVAHDERISARIGHPFRFRLSPSLEPHHLRVLIGVLPLLVHDLESVADPRVWTCQLAMHDRDELVVSCRAATMFITVGPRGWPSVVGGEGPRRHILDALGLAAPTTRIEYGRGTV